MLMIRNLAVLAMALALGSRGSAVGPPARGYRLYFPHLTLAPDEQVESFRVSVACGHIYAVTDIPNDWNVEVTRAISSVEALSASAGHGISYVRQLDLFNGSIRIREVAHDCFAVSAIVTATFDDERNIDLPSNQLRLVPDSAAQ